MEPHFEAIILRAFPSREADLMLRCLSPTEGKVSVLAKSGRKSQKRFGTTPDLFDYGRFEVRFGRGTVPLLQGFIPASSLKTLRTDLDKLALASLLSEAVDNLVPEGGASDHETYEVLLSGLKLIESGSGRADVFAAGFEALAATLEQAGFLDRSQLGAGSVNRFRSLIQRVEISSEKELASKKMVLTLLDQFREQRSRTP